MFAITFYYKYFITLNKFNFSNFNFNYAFFTFKTLRKKIFLMAVNVAF